jgi:hypothetical protein
MGAGRVADSADTVEGRTVHRRVDKPGGMLPAPPAKAAEDTSNASDAATGESGTHAGVTEGDDIATVERRLQEQVTHPQFGYRLSYCRLFELRARRFGRHLMGELADNPNFTTR